MSAGTGVAPETLARFHEQLEVLCITYNRAAYLDRTLQQLADSPVADCRITILDNASTDGTPAVCAAHERRLPDLRTVRHRKNVGASANYLHAVELATAPYTWVICDDDTYDFSDFGDVVEAVANSSFDLVSLGAAGGYRWVRGISSTTLELNRTHPGFHFVSSFVPSLIFRTELFDSTALAQGYATAGNLFPHFPFVRACAAESRTIHVARHQALIRNDGHNVLSPLHHFSLWMGNCRTIDDPDLRRQVVYECFEPVERGVRRRFVRALAEAVAFERLEHPDRLALELLQIALGLAREQRLLLLALMPIAVAPAGLLSAVRVARMRLSGAPEYIPPPPEVSDPLRL